MSIIQYEFAHRALARYANRPEESPFFGEMVSLFIEFTHLVELNAIRACKEAVTYSGFKVSQGEREKNMRIEAKIILAALREIDGIQRGISHA